MTKEQIYRQQMTELGIYEAIFEPEIRTLARIERELTRAMKAWSDTAPPNGKPSFLNDHYPVIQRLRAEALQHREALGLTPKALKKLVGAAGTDAPQQKDLITAKLDQIAARVAAYDPDTDFNPDWWKNDEAGAPVLGLIPDPYAGIPGAEEAKAISDKLDEDLAKAVAEDMG